MIMGLMLLFEGRSQLADSLQEICMRINNNFCHWGSVVSDDEEMMKILGHDRQKKMIEDSENDEIVEDKLGSVRLYVDDEENCYAQGNPDMELTPNETQVEMNDYCQKYSRKEKKAAEKRLKIYKHGLFYPIHSSKVGEHDEVQKGADEIWYVPTTFVSSTVSSYF